MEMQKRALELQNSHGPDQNNDSMQQQNNFQNNSYNEQSYQQMGGYEQNFNSNNKQYGSESGDNYPSNNSVSGNENSFDSQTFDQITNNKKKKDPLEDVDLTHLPNVNFSEPPPGYKPKEDAAFLAFQNGLPDLSKPPPGFPAFNDYNEELMPSVPYFELPAGLMVPLILVSKQRHLNSQFYSLF